MSAAPPGARAGRPGIPVMLTVTLLRDADERDVDAGTTVAVAAEVGAGPVVATLVAVAVPAARDPVPMARTGG